MKKVKKRVGHCTSAVPKNCKKNRKIFVTRIVYNSKLKSVNTCKANKNIHKNVQHRGINKHVKPQENAKVTNMLKPIKQKCHIVQDVCYNVPVKNRFGNLDTEIYSPINTCDKAVLNVVNNVPKQVHKKYKTDSSCVLDTKNTVTQLQTNNKGECVKYVDSWDSSNSNNSFVEQNLNRCSETGQIEQNIDVDSAELNRVHCGNSTYAGSHTEPKLSRDILCQVIDQECTGFPQTVPLWHCKLAKQMKLQEAGTVPDFQNWKKQNKF